MSTVALTVDDSQQSPEQEDDEQNRRLVARHCRVVEEDDVQAERHRDDERVKNLPTATRDGSTM